MHWVVLVYTAIFASVIATNINESRNTAHKHDTEQIAANSIENAALNLLPNKVISPTDEGGHESNGIPKNANAKPTTRTLDNDYQSLKRAFDTFNGKMDSHMAFYVNEMSFLTTKLNSLKDKFNAVEILHHEIDRVINQQNTLQQKLQTIQDAMFGSQSISGKLDRLELSIQQLHSRFDELMERQKQFSSANERIKQNKERGLCGRDEPVSNLETTIEQLVAFVHNFAELNRLENTDILNRLGNMQSQLIQFFDVKETITSNQSNLRPSDETHSNATDDSDEITQHATQLSDANAIRIASETNFTVDGIESGMKAPLLNLNDAMSSSNTTAVLKRKRTAHLRTQSRRRCSEFCCRVFIRRNRKRGKEALQRTKRYLDTSFDTVLTKRRHFADNNPNADVEVDDAAIRTDSQVSARYGKPSEHGCHQFANENVDRVDEIHRFPSTNGSSERLCSFDKNGTTWTIIQSRGLQSTPENFNRSWIEYKNGFGNLSGEFWIGNDLLHKLTYDDDMELKVRLETWDGRTMNFEYEIFRVDSEENRYNLFISGFRGGDQQMDALKYHHNQDFSTFDRQNDKSGINDERACCSCAKSYASGWWFNNCIEANLNGVYQVNPTNNNYVGIIWEKWLGDYSMKSTKMMIRPKIEWSNATHPGDSDIDGQKPPNHP